MEPHGTIPQSQNPQGLTLSHTTSETANHIPQTHAQPIIHSYSHILTPLKLGIQSYIPTVTKQPSLNLTHKSPSTPTHSHPHRLHSQAHPEPATPSPLGGLGLEHDSFPVGSPFRCWEGIFSLEPYLMAPGRGGRSVILTPMAPGALSHTCVAGLTGRSGSVWEGTLPPSLWVRREWRASV